MKNYWDEFYSSIKDPSWPDCPNEHYVSKLPQSIQNEIREQHDSDKFLNPSDSDFLIINYRELNSNLLDTGTLHTNQRYVLDDDFIVYYGGNAYDGEGTQFGQNLVRVVKYLYPETTFEHALDWCAGAGFIGFRLLNDRVCKNLDFVEQFETETLACHYTIANLPERYQKRDLQIFPSVADISAGQKYDLVVSNAPPPLAPMIADLNNTSDRNRTHIDINGTAHRDFFTNISKHLIPGARIIVQACSYRCSPKTYHDYADGTGLVLSKIIQEKIDPDFYYIEYTFNG